MYLIAIFGISGLSILVLLTAKLIEEKRRKQIFVLGIISMGNESVRRYSRFITHKYSEFKTRLDLTLTKRLPNQFKVLSNRAGNFLKEYVEYYTEKARNSRLLKRNGGISEFFKNISNARNRPTTFL